MSIFTARATESESLSIKRTLSRNERNGEQTIFFFNWNSSTGQFNNVQGYFLFLFSFRTLIQAVYCVLSEQTSTSMLIIFFFPLLENENEVWSRASCDIKMSSNVPTILKIFASARSSTIKNEFFYLLSHSRLWKKLIFYVVERWEDERIEKKFLFKMALIVDALWSI